jgi:hypothetical protein
VKILPRCVAHVFVPSLQDVLCRTVDPCLRLPVFFLNAAMVPPENSHPAGNEKSFGAFVAAIAKLTFLTMLTAGFYRAKLVCPRCRVCCRRSDLERVMCTCMYEKYASKATLSNFFARVNRSAPTLDLSRSIVACIAQ